MSLYETIESMLPELSKNERKVADHILKYPYDLKRYSGDSLAIACDVSRSAVIRFCHKLGFTGYSDFRIAFINEPRPKKVPVSEPNTSNRVLDVYRSCILDLDKNLNQAEIAAVSDLIMHANHTVVFGQLHSGLSAQQLAFRLNRAGIDSHAVSDPTIMTNYVSILKQNDVVIIISITGQKSYIDVVKELRKKHTSVILITMHPTSPLAKYADHVLTCPTAIYSNSDYLLDEAICFFLMIEVIIEAINHRMLANTELSEDAADETE